jgi:hypothetical protein
MNDSPSCPPIFEGLLININARLQEADQHIGNLREMLERLDKATTAEPLGNLLNKNPIEPDNSVIGRLRSFDDAFKRSNDRLSEVSERLRRLV